jgi:predicted ATPase
MKRSCIGFAAELALAEGDKVDAELKFGRALTLATAQSARMWELRAAKGLARLWREAGKVHEARAVLAPVLGSFTEGFDTRDRLELAWRWSAGADPSDEKDHGHRG